MCAPRRDDRVGANANLLGNREQIGLMRFEESDQRGKQRRIVRPAAKLVCPDSGQVKEPLRPAFVRKRRRKSGEGERIGDRLASGAALPTDAVND